LTAPRPTRLPPPKPTTIKSEDSRYERGTTGGQVNRYVSRIIRLAWLSPPVLERLVLQREPTVLTLKDLCAVAELAWADQPGRVFD
ncbi:MAG: hypothetical protein Q7J57_10870, partial [Gemmobacter sp.]|nr:hypothetical protein [Gemmobacter sp.]